MEKLEHINYEKINYIKVRNKLNNLSKNDDLLKLGWTKKTLTLTEYNYPLDCIEVGHGKNELFLVAGTHSSEIVAIDFIIQLLEQLPTFKDFDPNIFKLKIIPIQNPEGFDIASSNLNVIKEHNFQEKSYEYYLRYRTDSIIVNALNSLNNFINNYFNNKVIDATIFLAEFKRFIDTNPNWKKLEEKNCMPNIKIFNTLIKNIPNTTNFTSLKLELLNTCNITLSKLNTNNLHDSFLQLFINQLKTGFNSNNIWTMLTNENQNKLYQQMFSEDNKIKNLQNPTLEKDINNIYKQYNHPQGSQISHDATGIGINLNANHLLNRGIEATKNNNIIYGPGVKNNIKNYFPGPLGTPSKDVNNFTYAIENQALYQLLKDSYDKGNYLATILYHGTGGLIYYKPYEDLMSTKDYNEFYNYNQELANIYQQSTNYRILEEASTSGYGDLLRRTFPGVLMVELSKMGGNPIGPYGDKNNIYNTMNDNFIAIQKILSHFKEKINTPKKKIKDNA